MWQCISDLTPHVLTDQNYKNLQEGFFIWVSNSKDSKLLAKEAYSSANINSCFWYALSIFDPSLSKSKLSEAMFFFRKAADSGHKTAQLFAYICFTKGYGTAVNSSLAQYYFDLAPNLINHAIIGPNFDDPYAQLSQGPPKKANFEAYFSFPSKSYSSIGINTDFSSHFPRKQFETQDEAISVDETISVDEAISGDAIRNINSTELSPDLLQYDGCSPEELVELGKKLFSVGETQKAIEAFSIARDEGNVEAIWRLGKAISTENPAKSVQLYFEAMNKGDPYGTMYYAVNMMPFAEGQAAHLLHLAAKTLPEAQFLFGVYLKDSGASLADYVPYFKQSALGGDPNGAWAYFISLGYGVTRESLDLLEKSAEKGNNISLYLLGSLFEDFQSKTTPIETKPYSEKALQCFEKSYLFANVKAASKYYYIMRSISPALAYQACHFVADMDDPIAIRDFSLMSFEFLQDFDQKLMEIDPNLRDFCDFDSLFSLDPGIVPIFDPSSIQQNSESISSVVSNNVHRIFAQTPFIRDWNLSNIPQDLQNSRKELENIALKYLKLAKTNFPNDFNVRELLVKLYLKKDLNNALALLNRLTERLDYTNVFGRFFHALLSYQLECKIRSFLTLLKSEDKWSSNEESLFHSMETISNLSLPGLTPLVLYYCRNAIRFCAKTATNPIPFYEKAIKAGDANAVLLVMRVMRHYPACRIFSFDQDNPKEPSCHFGSSKPSNPDSRRDFSQEVSIALSLNPQEKGLLSCLCHGRENNDPFSIVQHHRFYLMLPAKYFKKLSPRKLSPTKSSPMKSVQEILADVQRLKQIAARLMNAKYAQISSQFLQDPIEWFKEAPINKKIQKQRAASSSGHRYGDYYSHSYDHSYVHHAPSAMESTSMKVRQPQLFFKKPTNEHDFGMNPRVPAAPPPPCALKSMESSADRWAEVSALCGYAYFCLHSGETSLAFELYSKAAKVNSIEALNALGYMYYHGAGVEQNSLTARKYFSRCIESNYPPAVKNLQHFTEFRGNGFGVSVSKERSGMFGLIDEESVLANNFISTPILLFEHD